MYTQRVLRLIYRYCRFKNKMQHKISLKRLLYLLFNVALCLPLEGIPPFQQWKGGTQLQQQRIHICTNTDNNHLPQVHGHGHGHGHDLMPFSIEKSNPYSVHQLILVVWLYLCRSGSLHNDFHQGIQKILKSVKFRRILKS